LALSRAPAADLMFAAHGKAGLTFVSAGIAVSTFGFLNLVILVTPRVYQAMAADGLFFGGLARLHPKYQTPAGAIVFQGIWATALVFTGTYGQLLDWVVFADWIFFGLTAATVFVYRRRPHPLSPSPESGEGERKTGFRTPGYPIVPGFFVAAAIYVVASSVWSNPRNALMGAGLLALGIPVFKLWLRRPRAAA
jgi:APA family basic amino acid/polyamine antiporter